MGDLFGRRTSVETCGACMCVPCLGIALEMRRRSQTVRKHHKTSYTGCHCDPLEMFLEKIFHFHFLDYRMSTPPRSDLPTTEDGTWEWGSAKENLGMGF